MKKMTTLIALITIFLATFEAFAQPKYASEESQRVIGKMVEAHGGLDSWRKAETVSFDNIMFSEGLGEEKFWISKITVDQKTKRVYQEWPLHNATMASDGKQAWSVNWKAGNPPKSEALMFYYFLNLPWLTQDKNVELGAVEKIKHKGFKNEVYVIRFGFAEKPVIGKTKLDSYKLFIDSRSYLLLGYEYMIGYGGMLDLMELPADKKLFGPMFRIHDSFTNVGGLTYPNRMHTGNLDQTQTYGYHAIINYDLTADFDESKMKVPKNAVIDKSSDKRMPKNK